MIRSHLRLAAGTLALALPLAAAAGCGAEKRKTVKQELASAQSTLEASTAAAFTLRLDDGSGAVAGLIAKDGDTPKALVDALLKGSITYIADPAGDATLKSVQSLGVSSAELKAQLEKVNLSFVIRDDQAVLGELRLVAGDLYLKVNLDEVGRLAKVGGVEDFDAQLDEAIEGMDGEFAQVLTDVRAGKFLKLPLAKYLDQLQELAGAVVPTPDPKSGQDLKELGSSLFAAVKPYITVTDANDSTEERVLDVKVQVRPALKAALGVLKAEKGLPFLGMFGDLDPGEVDKNVADGVAKGTITLKSSRLTQFAIDLESLRLLDPEADGTSLAGARLVVDVDDSADAVTVPTEVSTFDVGALIDQFMGSMEGMASMGGSASAYSG